MKSLKSMSLSAAVTAIVAVTIITATLLVANVAQIGFGGKVAPFVTGLAAAFVAVAIVASLRYATSSKSSDKAGLLIALADVTAVSGLIVLGFNQHDWVWAQFWCGIAVIGLALLAIATTHVYKVGAPKWLSFTRPPVLATPKEAS